MSACRNSILVDTMSLSLHHFSSQFLGCEIWCSAIQEFVRAKLMKTNLHLESHRSYRRLTQELAYARIEESLTH